MKHSVKDACVYFLFALLMLIPACATIDTAERVEADDILRVGVTTTYPPIIFRQGGKVAGVEADFARALGEELGKKIAWVELNWDGLVPALLDGKIDIIMAGMSVTEARQIRIAFSEPYLETGQMALMRHADTARYNSPESIKASEARIGVQDGTTGDVFVQTRCPKATKVSIGKPDDAMFYFAGNRMDIFIYDAPTIMLLASQHEAEVTPLWDLLTYEQLAWGIRKHDTDLLESANRLIAEWTESGKLGDVLSRWMPHSDRIRKKTKK